MAEGHGFGKVILFGEHFVVYGIPAIASAISSKTIAKIEPYDDNRIIIEDNRREIPGYKEEKQEHQRDSLEKILNIMNINPETPLKIILEGDLVAASGVGASAASCAAIARALSNHFNMNLSDKKINEIAYEGEKGYHGTPSGIDNTCATFGGLIWFKKGEQNVMEHVRTEKPVEIVMCNTGIVANTKAAVEGVKQRKEENPEEYNRIFEEAKNLMLEARRTLEASDFKKIGELMNKNQELLEKIGVSSEELDYLINLARENGAFGAKLTGGGLGGYMFALTPGIELQERIANAMKKEGFQVLKARIG